MTDIYHEIKQHVSNSFRHHFSFKIFVFSLLLSALLHILRQLLTNAGRERGTAKENESEKEKESERDEKRNRESEVSSSLFCSPRYSKWNLDCSFFSYFILVRNHISIEWKAL